MNQKTLQNLQPRVRLDYVDALRGLAALMVLVCHSLQVDPSLEVPSSLANKFEACKYGVQLFFVISGFTIFYSLHNSDSNTTNFFIRRFFRIAPLYFVAVIFYGWLYDISFTGIFLNLFFLHGFSPEYINRVVPGGWSIGVEMVFYCMVPFLFKKIPDFGKALMFFLITLIFSFVIFYAYRRLVPSTPFLESFVYFWLPNQLPIFALGFVTFYASFGKASPEAYERLLLDAMSGDATLFARRDEVEHAWEFIDHIEEAWHSTSTPPPLCEYPAGSWGPKEADDLLERDGRAWRRM
ncbi:MAG: hypothetical protein EOO01_28930 [Chitinophagaceae bacterium]|nr:MAG: hypothetical protein EOO01_28930 [Chitinophagaceae bacterium]